MRIRSVIGVYFVEEMEICRCSQDIVFSEVTVTVCITVHFPYRKEKSHNQ